MLWMERRNTPKDGAQVLLGCVTPAGHMASIAGELIDGVGQAIFVDADAQLPARMMKDHRVARLLCL